MWAVTVSTIYVSVDISAVTAEAIIIIIKHQHDLRTMMLDLEIYFCHNFYFCHNCFRFIFNCLQSASSESVYDAKCVCVWGGGGGVRKGGGGSGGGGGDIGDQFVYINIVSVLMLSIVYEIYWPAAYLRMGAPRLHYYSCFHPCL